MDIIGTLRYNGQSVGDSETQGSESHLLLVVSQPELASGGHATAYEALQHRLTHSIWGLNERTTCRGLVRPGVRVVFYTAGRGRLSRHFVARAGVLRSPGPFSRVDLPKYTKVDDWLFDIPAYIVQLDNIAWFRAPVSIHSVKSQMELFKDRGGHRWGHMVQGGIRRISRHDYELIVAAAGATR